MLGRESGKDPVRQRRSPTHRKVDDSWRARQDGFDKCVEDVFETHRNYLLRIALGILGSMDEAEDAVQDVFLRVLAGAPDERRIRLGVLVTSVKRTALDRHRSRAALTRVTDALLRDEHPLVEGALPGPERALRHARAERVLRSALERVPPAERAAFEAHDLSGLSYEQAGRALGRSPKTLRQAAYRARGRVKSWLFSHGFTSLADVSGPPPDTGSVERRGFDANR